jgi:hypothetical protein
VAGSPTFTTDAGDKLSVAAASGLPSESAGSAPPNGEHLAALPGQATTAHGTLTIDADRSFDYTPNAGFVPART